MALTRIFRRSSGRRRRTLRHYDLDTTSTTFFVPLDAEGIVALRNALVAEPRRELRVSRSLHLAVAEKVLADPSGWREEALTRLRADEEQRPHPLRERWRKALLGKPVDVVAICVDWTDEGDTLRSLTPFAGFLTEDERQKAIDFARSS